MKPSFALNLTDTSIGLLHRTQRGWMPVGETAVDAPDLDEALGYLRRSALGLAPRGVTCKVVIPNSQILYARIEAPGPDAGRRRAQIRAALDGRTPYAVDDLVFDWWGTGDEVQVAVVARETLAEAESFAVTHRFNPVSFVAIPDSADFGVEPWFGPSSLAATFLAPGEAVERDQDVISLPQREPAPGAADRPVETDGPVQDPPVGVGEYLAPAVRDADSAGLAVAEPADDEGPVQIAGSGSADTDAAARRAARAARRAEAEGGRAKASRSDASSPSGSVRKDDAGEQVAPAFGGTVPFGADEAASPLSPGDLPSLGAGAERPQTSSASDAPHLQTDEEPLRTTSPGDVAQPVSGAEVSSTPQAKDLPGATIAETATPDMARSGSAITLIEFDAPAPARAELDDGSGFGGPSASVLDPVVPDAPMAVDVPEPELPEPESEPVAFGSDLSEAAPPLPARHEDAAVAPDQPVTAADVDVPDEGPQSAADVRPKPMTPMAVAPPITFSTRRSAPRVGETATGEPDATAPKGRLRTTEPVESDPQGLTTRIGPLPGNPAEGPQNVPAPTRANAPAVPNTVAERLAARIRAKAEEGEPYLRPKPSRTVPAISGGSTVTVPRPGSVASTALPATPQALHRSGAASAAQALPGSSVPSAVPPSSARPVAQAAVRQPASPTSTARTIGAFVTAPNIPGVRRKKAQTTDAPVSFPPATATAIKPLTKPGGTFGTKAAQRGTPKYLGLVLTGLLLLFLAIIAAWSTIALATRDPGASDPATAAVPAIEDEMLADQQDPSATGMTGVGDAAPVEQADAAIVPPAPLADPATLISRPDVAALPEPAAVPPATAVQAPGGDATARVESPDPVMAAPAQIGTESASLATVPPASEPVESVPADLPEPPVASEPAPGLSLTSDAPTPAVLQELQDEIFLSAMDAPPAALDPAALPPAVSAPDGLPVAQVPPPPFGTVYQFDAAGNIQPTPDGIVTPEGVRLVAGRPPLEPPARPADLALPAPAVAEAAPLAEATAVASTASAPLSEAFPSDPALADARPRSRPEGLIPPPDATTVEDDAALAIDPGSRLASLRPLARPAALLAAGEAARIASQGASLSQQAAALTASAALDPDASPLAIAVSRKPAPRPRDISRAIDAAVAAAVRAPEPESAAPTPELAAAATIATPRPERVAAARPDPDQGRPAVREADPETEDEPEVANAAPRIPTRASVAKQATFVNAINLSKVNLIGVYGTSSKRYAMVRQANGRYKKVAVGDKVDGGTVAAITASELRYQKGGRMLSLTMPKG